MRRSIIANGAHRKLADFSFRAVLEHGMLSGSNQRPCVRGRDVNSLFGDFCIVLSVNQQSMFRRTIIPGNVDLTR